MAAENSQGAEINPRDVLEALYVGSGEEELGPYDPEFDDPPGGSD